MSNDSVKQLADILRESQIGSQIARENSNFAKPTYGKIVDVNDPESRGRVKVIMDEANPQIHIEDGFLEPGPPTVTDWMEPKVPFKGRQPPTLINRRVPLEPKQGDPNRLFFGSPVYDPDETGQAVKPTNSDATRLQVYPDENSMPPADKENVGLMIIVEDCVTEGYDCMKVCLKVKGEYQWV